MYIYIKISVKFFLTTSLFNIIVCEPKIFEKLDSSILEGNSLSGLLPRRYPSSNRMSEVLYETLIVIDS